MTIDVESIKRGNPLAATVQRLTGQPIVRHKIASPWRDERTPSLHIYDDGRWVDYGSGEKGDVIDFVGKFYFGNAYNPNVHFKDVLDKLGALDIAPLPPSKQPARQPQEKPKLTIDPDLVRHWHTSMPAQRRVYLYSRGLCDPVIDQFLIGWDGKRYTIPATYRGVPFGVKRRKAPDVDDGIPEKYVQVKGSRGGIFNIDAAMAETRLVICEGEIDAMLLTQFGFPAVSCTVGAGGWKREWSGLFGGVHDLFILYDNDEAGRKGRHQVWQTMRRANLVTLPDGIKDVGELIEKYDFPLTWLEANLQ